MNKYYGQPFLKRKTGFYLPFSAIALITILFSSCVTTKHSAYFKTIQEKDTTLKGFVTPDFESKIVPGDRLAISVSSLNPVEDALFNGGIAGGSSVAASSATSSTSGYTVQPDGAVVLHRIGSMQVAGFTRKQLALKIEEKLLPYLKEPIVQVNYLNRKVTVMGEVTKPGVINMPEEKLSLIDALVLSGDVTANAKRNNITVIRDEGNERKIKHVNLEDHSIFSSEWYYLKPDDIVFVSTDTEKADKAEKRARLQTDLSLVVSGVTLLIIILDRVIK